MRSNRLSRVEVTIFITVIYFRLISRMSGLKASINTRYRITTLIDNPPIPCIVLCVSCIALCVPCITLCVPCIALCVLCIVMLVAVATNIIGYTPSE